MIDTNKERARKFLKDHPEIEEWFDEETDKGSAFAESVYDWLFQHGELTQKQEYVIRQRIAEKK